MTQPLTHAERGRLGARKRWGEPRVIRLDNLTQEQRRTVAALVRSKEQANMTGDGDDRDS